VLAAAGAAVGFGVSYPLTAVALRSFSPLGTAAIPATIALVLILGLALAGILPRPTARAWRRHGLVRLAVLGSLGGVGFIAGMNMAVSLAGPTIAGFVATLYAVFASLLAVPILGERLRMGTVAAFGVALAGTALLAGFQPLGSSVAGIAFGLMAAVCFGLYLVLARRWTVTAGLDGTSITVANLLGRGPLLLAVQLVIDRAGVFPGSVEAASAVAIVGLALVPSMLSQLLLIASVRRVAARRTSASLLLTPVTAALLAAIALGERPTTMEALGGALVVAGIAGASGALGATVNWIRGARTPASGV
jgi:drug/metabolite transporter (DMT)-like permease